MIKRIGFIITVGFVILFAAGSAATKDPKAAENKNEINEPSTDSTVTVSVNDLADNSVSEDMLIGYKDKSYYNSNEDTITVDVSDLTSDYPITEDMITGYKDDSYYNSFAEEYSHKTVIVAVDPEILDTYKVKALCEKYALDITYDYNSFDMYALSSAEELSDEALNTLIDELSNEDGIISVSKDYIAHITDNASVSGGFGLCIE